jgi:hypothetical protein
MFAVCCCAVSKTIQSALLPGWRGPVCRQARRSCQGGARAYSQCIIVRLFARLLLHDPLVATAPRVSTGRGRPNVRAVARCNRRKRKRRRSRPSAHSASGCARGCRTTPGCCSASSWPSPRVGPRAERHRFAEQNWHYFRDAPAADARAVALLNSMPVCRSRY